MRRLAFKNKILLSVATLLLLAGALIPARFASASVNDFVINSFKSDMTLSRADKQGTLNIKEDITVTFSDYNHGIERAIPKSYKGHPLDIKINSISSQSGAPAQYTTYDTNGNEVLRIGDPNRTVTGFQQYEIDYTVSNAITFYKDHDELYWDINGDQWLQPTTYVSATIHLPSGVRLLDKKCYAGLYGKSDANCMISKQGASVVQVDSIDDLGPQQTLTAVLSFDKGYFTAPTIVENLRDNWIKWVGFILMPLIGFLAGFVIWLTRGRDAKGRGVIVPQYAPPESLALLQVGTLADFKADNRDFIAVIIDLARRGYIQIIEKRKDRKILKDKLSYNLKLLNSDTTELDAAAKDILEELFSPFQVGTQMAVGSYDKGLATSLTSLRKSSIADLQTRGYLKSKPFPAIISISLIFTFWWLAPMILGQKGIHDFLPIVGGSFIGIIIFSIFARYFASRTAKGVEVYEQIMGLKMYMEVAEKDRLEKLEGPNAEYADWSKEPEHTVEFFEKLLPYAIMLGVETQWSDQFKDIYKTPPDWYAGSNVNAFNAGYLTGSLNSSFVSSMNTSFTPPSSSGSSGFGGGGFSGGGGGGGGGGGW